MTPLWLSSARNGDLSCVSLGILLLHTHVRDGASKGKPESRQWLDGCFYNRITRKVRKDSTVTIDGVCYDVPMQFISAKVDIRFQPDDISSAFILFDDQKFPIRQTNRNENYPRSKK
ncbi:hypothetical protein DW826_00915 [Clostridium sp. AM34-11AC]|nr:hypothetical protein DW677_07885 [Clostridium sp. AM25-23AC]RGE08690.1 hypothetical protein DW826_00915 [Clostridium sp. AM34-11AC]